MNKNYMFCVCFLVAQFVFSQLSGVYTIGATSSDYTTIKSAVADLTTNGLSGPVIFNLKDGVYNESNIEFGIISGISSINTVTFQSENLNAENVIIDGINIFEFNNGSKYISFKHLKFDTYSSNSASKRAFDMIGTSISNITITNCIFISSLSVSTEYFNDYIGARSNHCYIRIAGVNNLNISDNTFSSIGAVIFKVGNSSANNVIFSNNILTGDMVTPIYLSKVENLTINGNNYNGNVKYRSMYLTFLSGISTISSNKVYTSNQDLNDNWTSAYISSNQTLGGNLIFKNNFISARTSLLTSGFNNTLIANNSFYSSRSHCLHILGNDYLESLDIYNNIFYSNDGFPNIKISQNLDLTLLNSNNNAFSKEKNTFHYYIANSNVSDYYDFTDWVVFSGKEINSKVVRDVYASETDFHTPNAFMLNGAGVSISNITHDIDGEIRNLSNPDIGADEFDMDYNTFLDLEISSIDSPSNIQCEDSNVVLSIKNNCSTLITSFSVECSINNFRGNISNYNLSINPGQTIQVPIDNFEIVKNTLYEKIEFFVSAPNGLLENNYSNDFKSVLNTFQLGNYDIFIETNNCDGNSATLSVPIFSNTSINWSTGETTNSIDIDQLGTYSVTITDNQGCSLSKSITLN